MLIAFVSSFFLDVSRGQLQQQSLTGPSKSDSGSYGSLMATLMKQRPKGVSHLLQDNLPSCTFFLRQSFSLHTILKLLCSNLFSNSSEEADEYKKIFNHIIYIAISQKV
jgi:hypothetical protein